MNLRSGTRISPMIRPAAGCTRLLATMGVLVFLGAWSVQAAELPSAKKPKAPAETLKSPANVQEAPVVKTPTSPRPGSNRAGVGSKPTIPPTAREPVFNDGSEASPCAKRSPTIKLPGKFPKSTAPCADEETSETGSDEELDEDLDMDPDSDLDLDSDLDQSGTETEDAGEESKPSFDYDELTGKVPGFTPFGGEDSGSSEGSTVEGGRPWYEKLGKPGGGRPPADDDEE
ncbi:MAG: hypothetical protein ABIO65_01945 [Nitrospiria bacterium]